MDDKEPSCGVVFCQRRHRGRGRRVEGVGVDGLIFFRRRSSWRSPCLMKTIKTAPISLRSMVSTRDCLACVDDRSKQANDERQSGQDGLWVVGRWSVVGSSRGSQTRGGRVVCCEARGTGHEAHEAREMALGAEQGSAGRKVRTSKSRAESGNESGREGEEKKRREKEDGEREREWVLAP